jgi:hypothetical protein
LDVVCIVEVVGNSLAAVCQDGRWTLRANVNEY